MSYDDTATILLTTNGLSLYILHLLAGCATETTPPPVHPPRLVPRQGQVYRTPPTSTPDIAKADWRQIGYDRADYSTGTDPTPEATSADRRKAKGLHPNRHQRRRLRPVHGDLAGKDNTSRRL